METLNFKDLNLSEDVKRALTEMGFEEATPIQSQSIPHILEGKDVIGQAQTGTGKTCAFGIPAIEMVDPEIEGIQVLVLCPTRELAIQSVEELKSVARFKSEIKILPIYGGQPIDRQITALKKRPQIIIGTPGRVMDHMRRHTLKFSSLRMIILDEADEMLNMGFREDIDTILEKVPEEKQTILFSATMPKEILDLTSRYLKNPTHIKVAHKEVTVPTIEQFYLEVSSAAKLEVLARLIDANSLRLSLVFCNTKKKVDELTSSLQSRGYSVEALHGDMRQEQRDKVMSQFRKGHFDILIATDVAARGIDVDDIDAVFNYDLPNDEEYYVHRIGRTGRAGRVGRSYTFVSGREILKLRDIQRYTKSTIKLIKPPTVSDVEENKINKMLEALKAAIAEREFEKYASYIEKTIDELNAIDGENGFITTLDVAAALLKMYATQTGNSVVPVPELDNEDTEAEGDMVRLFINIGRSSKIQPKHILQSIANTSGMPGKLVGAIDIYDNYTFVEVPREYAHEVLESMKDSTLGGKRINVEKSNKRKSADAAEGASGRRSGGKYGARSEGKPEGRTGERSGGRSGERSGGRSGGRRRA